MPDKRLNDEEEYQFPEQEFGKPDPSLDETEAQYVPVPPQAGRGAHIVNIVKTKLMEKKRLVAIVGIVIVVFIAFNLMRPHHTTQIISETPPKTVVTQQAATTPTPVTPAVSTESLNSFRQSIAGSTELTNLKQVNTNTQNQLNQLQQQVSNLQNNLKQLSDSQVDLSHNLNDLSDQIKQISMEMLSFGQKTSSSKSKIILKPLFLVYHVRAVVPGRAWLVDDDGGSITVAVGDQITGYGVVKSIDSQQGVVVTSSGKEINFKN